MFGRETIEADLNRHFSKFVDDLWDDEENASNMIEVKRISSKDFNKHSWRIYENSKIAVIIDSESLNKKQIKILLSNDGFNFLIATYKAGNKNLTKIKKALGSFIKNAKNNCGK